jgi:transcriptional regulator with XRE-family HTH domain
MMPLKDRIALAMSRSPQLKSADLARACKVSTASVADWQNGKTKTLKPEPARLAAALFGCDQNWIGTGVGVPNWSATPPRLRGEAIKIEGLYEFTVPPISKWEELLTEVHKPRLRITAPDDALPDDAPRGTELILSTVDPKPQRGDIVLVRDSHGMHYLRRYAEGRAGTWRAVTGRSDGIYLDLDSTTDGLALVAVAEWIKPKRG